MYDWKKIVKESMPLLSVCLLIEIVAGQILYNMEESLLMVPLVLTAVPVINGVGGNLGTILGARLSSGLHLGYFTPSIWDKKIHTNWLSAILLGAITYGVLAILIYLVVPFLGVQMNIDMMRFAVVFLGAGLILAVVIAFSSVVAAAWSFKKGVDPDNVVAPVVSTIGDFLGITSLFFMIWVIGL